MRFSSCTQLTWARVPWQPMFCHLAVESFAMMTRKCPATNTWKPITAFSVKVQNINIRWLWHTFQQSTLLLSLSPHLLPFGDNAEWYWLERMREYHKISALTWKWLQDCAFSLTTTSLALGTGNLLRRLVRWSLHLVWSLWEKRAGPTLV